MRRCCPLSFLPAEGESAQQEPAEGGDSAGLMACYDPHTGGYFVCDAVTNCVVDAGPYALDVIVDNWPGIQIESTEADAE